MSTPLATIFHGDVTLEQGSDVTQFGWGDININRRCIIQGVENSTTNTDGALIVAGGVGISKTLNVHENLNVLYGITNLTETHINTNDGPFRHLRSDVRSGLCELVFGRDVIASPKGVAIQ